MSMIIPYQYSKTYRRDLCCGNTAILECNSKSPMMALPNKDQLDSRFANKAVIRMLAALRFIDDPQPMVDPNEICIPFYKKWIVNLDSLRSPELTSMWPELLQHLNCAQYYNVREEHDDARDNFQAPILKELKSAALSASLLCHESLVINIDVIITVCFPKVERLQDDDNEYKRISKEVENNYRLRLRTASIEYNLSRWPTNYQIGFDDVTCALCLEDNDPLCDEVWLPCEHGFHRDCIVKWLHIKGICPICRCRYIFD